MKYTYFKKNIGSFDLMKKRSISKEAIPPLTIKMKTLRHENKLFREEIKELQNAPLIKKLNASLDRISKGRFVTRDKLGL